MKLHGIHHITAICGKPQPNIDFYTGVLGLRMVKLTVNFDQPSSYHLYFGDETGNPGTVLTFFSWPELPRGRAGPGTATALAFSVPSKSLPFWESRLRGHKTGVSRERRFGEDVITFSDPDGLVLELVARDEEGSPWERGGVDAHGAITGFHGITLTEDGFEKTQDTLTKTMGLKKEGEDEGRFRYAVGNDFVDVLCHPSSARGIVSGGTVHHVAYRTPNDEEQVSWRKKLVDAGLNVTPVINRYYFHSIYFREPGGVLFEIATDPPGFMIDESKDRLGTGLMLPPWLEKYRKELEGELPPVKLPKGT
jgi:catechol 2,3-dioxygenase-like lactoylglutathione lyase family enzyme